MFGSPRRAAFAGVFAATLVAFLAVGAVLPILPRYVQGPLDGGDIAVGIVTGAFALAAVIGRPIGGRLADEHGRKPIVLIGMALCSVAACLYYVPLGVAGIVFARLVLGLGDGWLYTASATWIVDLAPEERRGQAIGLFGMAIWGGLSLGPLFGELLLSIGSYEAVWAFAAATPLLAAAMVLRLPERLGDEPEAAERRAAPAEADLGRSWRTWVPEGVALPGAALLLGNIGYAAFAGFVVLHLEREDIGHGGAAFVAFASAVVIGRLVLGGIPDRHGPRISALAAGLLEATGLLLIGLAGSLPVAFAGAMVMGLGFSLLFPALALVAIAGQPAERRGAVLGVFTAFFDLGVGIGGPLAGAIAASTGYREAFFTAAVAALAGAALGVLAARGAAGTPPRTGAPPAPEPV
jgi:MFS family permease